MAQPVARRIKSFLKRKERTETIVTEPTRHSAGSDHTRLTSPVENYYRHKAETNLPVFYRFALQTRSLDIRDTFAKTASTHGFDLKSLLELIQESRLGRLSKNDTEALQSAISWPVMLTLADLLANSARHDLDRSNAVLIYDFVHAAKDDEYFEESHRLQYVEAVHELGDYAKAEQLIQHFNISELSPLQPELLQIQKLRQLGSIEDWLSALNGLYASLGMTQLSLLSDTSLPLMDRLSSDSSKKLHGPKVSVIMPTFAPGPGIRTAIRGLLQQSWQNLEIIVVNDASPNDYTAIFREVEAMDPRISVVHLAENSGAYVARNAGLEIATGEFITTHDDDDWSHPDKLANQVQVMVEDPTVAATTSGHMRTSEELEFRRVNMRAKYLQMNYSSLMFRRELIDSIGPWDTVNRGGDSELYTRLEQYVGSDRIVGLHDVPLSFSRVWEGSLTSGEMSRGYFSYSRLLYRWSFRQWHWDTKRENREAVRTPGDIRPYAVPTTFEAGQRKADLGRFDVVYVTDFFRQAKYVDFVLNEIETLVQQGLRVGYIHLYSPETTRPAGFPKRLFELQHEGRLTQLAHDDRAHTDLLLVYDSSIGMFADQLSSTVTSTRSLVIHHSLPTLSGAAKRSAVNHSQALENLDRCFDTYFEIVGATGADQHELKSLLPPSRLASDALIWRTHIRAERADVKAPTGKPVVGFHSYGNQYRWPNSSDKFRELYASTKFITHLYGHLDSPLEKFGAEAFESMEIINADEMSESDFLKSIDFWIYSPHYRLQDQIWEPVLSALEHGKVVILPSRLSEIYGDACVYAEAHQIDDLIAEFTADAERFLRQARIGQKFVESHYTAHHLSERISTIRSN